ncbi:MAG TPA: helix-turn-helix domain-containing protein [Candidatus Cybelea sp.]|nr:helix-turn-helix domain-containing protein [Candidatus Cybelea sp.]
MNTEYTRFIDQSNLVSLVPSTITWEQLEPGELDVAYRVLQVGPLVVSSRTVNLAFRGYAQVSAHRSGIIAVESDGLARWRGTEFDATRLAVGNEIDVRTSGKTTIFGMVVDERALGSRVPDSLDASDLVDRLTHNKVTHAPDGAGAFRAAIKAICGHREVPLAASGTLIPMMAAMLDSADEYSVERSHCLNRRYAAVRACEKYMREHVAETITLLDLSRASGMRSRSLMNAFEAIVGFSPMDYLKRLRLSAVRRALVRPGSAPTRIIDIAMEWGFSHMGHFARDYRAMFGEPPSQTLAGVRRALAVT